MKNRLLMEVARNRDSLLWILKVACLISLVWLPFYLTFYPGVGMHDEISVSQSPKGSTNQPIMYGIFLGGFYKLGLKIFHDHLIGTGVAILLLMVLMSIAIAYILWWLKDQKVNQLLVILYGLYFTFTPIIIDYAIAAVKDKAFGVVLMLLIPVTYNLAKQRFREVSLKKMEWFFLLCIAMMWTRNNGGYIFIAFAGSILVFMQGNKKLFVKWAASVLLIGMAPSLIMGSNFTEGLGVPLQQICRVVALDRELPASDKRFIEQMKSIDKIKAQYDPRTVDAIKWTPGYNRQFVDHHKKEFFKTWFSLMWLYPGDYFEAWRLNTQGFWGYLEGCEWQSKFGHSYEEEIYTTKKTKVGLADGFKVSALSVLPENLKEKLGHYVWDYSTYIPSGVCLWLTILIGCVMIYKKQYELLLVLAPAFFCSMTLILAAPIAKAFRYTFYYALCLPLFAIIPFLDNRGKAGAEKR